MQIEPYAYPTPPTGSQPQPLPLSYYSLPSYEKDEISLKQLLGLLRRRAWIIAGVAVAVTGAIWSWTLTRPAVYQSGFQMLVEPITNLNKSPDVLLFGTYSNFDYATQIEVLRSPELLQTTVNNLQKLYPDISYGEVVGSLGISQVLDSENRVTKILSVSYKGRDPQRVKAILDQLSKDYVQYSIKLRQTSLQQGVQYVEDQLPELRQRVNQLQTELEKFRQKYSLVDPETRGDQLSGYISSIEKQRQETQAQLIEAQSLYGILQQQVGAYVPADAIAGSALSESQRYQALLNQVRQIETQIAAESARFQPNSPNIQALEDKRQTLLPLLEQEAQRTLKNGRSNTANENLAGISVDLNRQLVTTANQLQVLQMRNRALVAAEQRLKEEFSLVPSLARRYTDLQREVKIATESLNRFLSTRENLQLEAAQRSQPWQLLTMPSLPGAPVSPNIPRNLMMGVIAGLLLGVGAALLAEKLDNVFHSANDLKDTTRLPLLAIIPYSKQLKELAPAGSFRRLIQPRNPLELFGSSQTNVLDTEQPVEPRAAYNSSPFLDAFRSLHTNIRFLSSDEPIRSLVVGSAVPADGKSTVAVHLAQAAAAMGQRVLLVDADLRRPQVHSLAGLPNMRGLSNLISGDIHPNEVIQPSQIDDNFFVITAGQIPPDPTKLLSSKKMHNLAEQFRGMFDLVIYDTPPLLGLADSSLLATFTDGIILVVGLGRTDRSALMQALDGLKVSSTSVLGIVANGVEDYAIGDYYRSYYHRYYGQKPVVETETSN